MSKCTSCGELISEEREVCPRCGAKKSAGLDKDFTKRLRIAGFPRIADAVEALQEELAQVVKERDALKEKLNASATSVVEVVRCKDCANSSEPKSISRYDLYCNNYDVRFCEKEQKIVCGSHFCSYGRRSDT